jgi:anti-sigma B factor antagonist
MAESAASIILTEVPERVVRDPSGGAPGAFRLTAFGTLEGTVVALTGELDIATAPVLEDYFRTLGASSPARLVIDIAALAFCGCAGLDVLLSEYRRAVAAGGWLRICGATPSFLKILRITELSEALRCYPTAADAFIGHAPPRISAAAASERRY